MTNTNPATGPRGGGASAVRWKSTGFGTETRDALRRTVATRPRRWLLAGTMLLGLFVAVAVTAATPPGERTFAGVSDPVQSLMSVVVPFLGILLVHDRWRPPGPGRLAPTLLAAVLAAVPVGLVGALGCATALAVAPSGVAPEAWRHAGTVTMGGVLVQVVARLVGTGLGLLLRSFGVAALASIVLPLGLWFLLEAVGPLRPAQGWLAPYATVRHLLSGEMTPLRWAQWLTVLLLWGVGLNTLGAARRTR